MLVRYIRGSNVVTKPGIHSLVLSRCVWVLLLLFFYFYFFFFFLGGDCVLSYEVPVRRVHSIVCIFVRYQWKCLLQSFNHYWYSPLPLEFELLCDLRKNIHPGASMMFSPWHVHKGAISGLFWLQKLNSSVFSITEHYDTVKPGH